MTTTEDTDYTFTTADFPLSDADGDLLSYVIITTLPEAGKGSIYRELLQFSQLPVQTSEGRISQGHLRYVPPADANGPAYASFKFKVEDTGTATSASEYTMTINVTPVNDAATGRPSITGNSKVGNTLTASTSGIIDVEGLPGSFTYQWKRFAADGTTFEANIGTNSRTYTLTSSEEGKKVKVEVSFTDNGGTDEGPLVSSAFPSSRTVQVPYSDATLLSNLSQAGSNRSETGLMAQQFTTGSSNTGWDLSQVKVTFNSAANRRVTVTVREDSDGAPGPIKYTLSVGGNESHTLNFTTATTVNFNAPADAKLYAGSKYWVVVTPATATDIHYPLVPAGSVDSGATTGWSFNGRIQVRSVGGTPFVGHPFDTTLQMAIVGHETSEILVSNSGQTDSSRIGIGPFLVGDFETAQSFSTGRNPDGYVLASATINLGGDRLETMPRVTVNADSNGAPGQVLYTLENPSNIVSISSTPSDFTFSAPAQARLTAGRTYWIVIHSTGRAMDLRITESDAEDDGKQAGWIIGDGRLDRNRRSSDPWSVPAAVHYPPGSIAIKLVGHLVVTTINEPTGRDFPHTKRTLGFVSSDWTSSGRLTYPADGDPWADYGDSGWGDMFNLVGLEPRKTYRVEVDFTRVANTVGGSIQMYICCNHGPDPYAVSEWDSNYDGRAIFDFDTGWTVGATFVSVIPSNSMNPDVWEFGDYTVTLTDVTGLTRLVSNTSQRPVTVTYANIGKSTAGTPNTTVQRAIAFTTGGHTDGYTLDRITAYISLTDGTDTGTGAPKVAIHRDGTDKPGAKLCDLQMLADYDTGLSLSNGDWPDRLYAPDCADNTLAASTTYWVVFSEDSSEAQTYWVGRANSSDEDPHSASSWGIGNSQAGKVDEGNWMPTITGGALAIGVYGTPK